MKKKIIALSAKVGAGKSFVSEYISKKVDIEVIRYSKTLSEILEKLNLEKNRKNLQDLSLSLRNIFGENVLENAVLHKIRKSKKEIIILDGVRREEDYNLIEKKTDFFLIFIDVDEEVRQKRISLRNDKRDDKNKKIEVLKKEEMHDSETKDTLRDIADFIVNNNGTLEALKKDVDEILEKIL